MKNGQISFAGSYTSYAYRDDILPEHKKGKYFHGVWTWSLGKGGKEYAYRDTSIGFRLVKRNSK